VYVPEEAKPSSVHRLDELRASGIVAKSSSQSVQLKGYSAVVRLQISPDLLDEEVNWQDLPRVSQKHAK
jgi:hypothetical protein